MKPWLRAVLVVALAVLASPVRADEKTLVVGVEEIDYYPFYGWLNGAYRGTARDILDAFAAAKGYRLVYKAEPIKRLYADLVSGGIDAKFPDNPDWATESKRGVAVSYSRPLMDYTDGVMVLPGRAGKSVTTLGTVAGFTPFAWLGRLRDGSVKLKENTRIDRLLRQVLLGRVDGAYVNVTVADHVLGAVLGRPGGLVFDPSLPYSRGSYHLSTATHPEVAAELDSWLAANAARVAEIKRRYGVEGGPR
ncbi:MAG: transporter substrate-binding domain-containing protein [Magnetospirillum sp.]|nr:transporter substrate-binding domain-containing protein [Magnetospirillum sp.]